MTKWRPAGFTVFYGRLSKADFKVKRFHSTKYSLAQAPIETLRRQVKRALSRRVRHDQSSSEVQ